MSSLAGWRQMVRRWDRTQDTLTAIYGEWGQCSAACPAHHTWLLLRRGCCQWCEHCDLQASSFDIDWDIWIFAQMGIYMQFFHCKDSEHHLSGEDLLGKSSKFIVYSYSSQHRCQNLSTQFGVVSIWPRTRQRPWRLLLRSPEPCRKLDIYYVASS